MANSLLSPPKTQFSHSAFRGRIGISRREIAPPTGIYARNFAYLKEGTVTTGTHSSLSATAVVLLSESEKVVLVAVDASWFKDPQDERELIRKPVLDALNLPESHLIISYSHTHSGPSVSPSESNRPGGEHIVPYMKQMSLQIIDAIREADKRCSDAVLTWATGKCDLAVVRDQVDPNSSQRRIIVGFDPDVKADDTLVVGRITREEDGAIIGTIVNYACHPISFGWQNTMASPDFVGPMRECVESQTGNAPCLFLQGASGDLAPRRQYVAELEIVEHNARQIGFAVLSTLESMLKPGHTLRYHGIVESGAPLGVWKQQKAPVSDVLRVQQLQVPLPLKQRVNRDELIKQIEECKDSTLRERLSRDLRISRFVGDGAIANTPAWIWRLGDGFIVAHPNEAYSQLQLALRSRFPDHTLAVLNLANGWCGYLPPKDLYDINAYAAWQTPFGPGALEILTDLVSDSVSKMLGS